MRIIDKTNVKWTELYDTHSGDIFFFKDVGSWGDEPFMRIKEVSEVQCCECDHSGCYVLNLESFDVWEPSTNEKVRVVNSELIITNKED